MKGLSTQWSAVRNEQGLQHTKQVGDQIKDTKKCGRKKCRVRVTRDKLVPLYMNAENDELADTNIMRIDALEAENK